MSTPRAELPSSKDLCIRWYVVPWGAVPEKGPGVLKYSLRIMLEQSKDGSGTHSAAEVLADWPSYLQRIARATLHVDGQDVPIDPAAQHRQWLQDHRISPERASELWQAFVDIDPNAKDSHRAVNAALAVPPAARNKFVKYHCSATLARLTRARLRQVFQETLPVGQRPRSTLHRLLTAPEPNAALATAFRGAAAVYPHRLKASRDLGEVLDIINGRWDGDGNRAAAVRAERDRGPRLGWAEAVLQAQTDMAYAADVDGRAAAPPTLSVSANCALHLLTRPEEFATPDDRQVRPFSGEDQLDDFAKAYASRKLAYASSPESHSSERAMRSGPDTGGDKSVRRQNTFTHLAGLVNHPWLAKLFGLTIDFELPFPDVADARRIRKVGVAAFHEGGRDLMLQPIFSTMMEDGFPRPRPVRGDRRDYRRGVLDVSAASGFLLTDIDVDRTPDRYMQEAIAQMTQTQVGAAEPHRPVALASQETSGLALIEVDAWRKKRMLQPDASDDNGTINAAAVSTGDVYLEHLLVGYRPDVRNTDGGTWRSLCVQRLKRVALDGRDITAWFAHVGPSEALLLERTRSAEVGSSKDKDAPTPHFLEGELFRWSVWGIGQEPTAPHNKPMPSEQIGKPLDVAPEQQRLTIEYESLDVPPQRYGRNYRFGVRLAMADGNSLSIDEAAQRYAEHACTIGDEETGGDANAPGMPMLRMESVLPPRVLLRDTLDRRWFPRESARYLVVASGAGRRRTRKVSKRVLVPPRTANLETCIRHGMLDNMLSHSDWPRSAFSHAERTKDGNFPLVDSPAEPDVPPLHEQQYRPLYLGAPDRCKPPYYPDPIARVAVLAFYREGDELPLGHVTFDHYAGGTQPWPECNPLFLTVRSVERVSSPRGIELHVHRRGVDVDLAPSVRVILRTFYRQTSEDMQRSGTLRQAIEPTRADLATAAAGRAAGSAASVAHTAVVQNLLQWAGPGRLDATTMATPRPDGVMDASVWMLNPFETLSLRHAVDRPTRLPFLVDDKGARDGAMAFQILRTPGESRIEFDGHLWLDRASTGRIDAIAQWMDNAMRPARTGAEQAYTRQPNACSQSFFMIKDIAIVPADDFGTPATSPQEEHLPSWASLQRLSPAASLPAQPRAARRPFAPVHDVGDTRARVIDIVLHSVSRDAGEFSELEAGGAPAKSPARTLVLRGTTRPPPLVIDHVMPLLHWTSGDMPADLHRRTREAGWFRIWLGGDWYESGNGELLALLYSKDPVHPELEPWTTQWGLDPTFDERLAFNRIDKNAFQNELRSISDIRASGGPAGILDIDEHHLAASALPSANFKATFDLASLPEHQGLSARCSPSQSTVNLALYRPVLDPVSGRMYADIRLLAKDAAMPFVRLAMARYQPLALPGLELSPVTASEFAQLLPERSLSVTIASGTCAGRKTARVVLVGPAAKVHQPERRAWWRSAGEQAASEGEGARHSEFRANIEYQKFGVAHGPAADHNGAWLPARGADEDVLLVHDVAADNWCANIEFDHQISRIYSLRLEEFVVEAGKPNARGNPIYFDRIVIHF